MVHPAGEIFQRIVSSEGDKTLLENSGTSGELLHILPEL